MKSVKIVLSNDEHELDYNIELEDNQLAHDWFVALQNLLQKNYKLDKDFCFLGFPNGPRTLSVICDELNQAVKTINEYNKVWNGVHKLKPYMIEDVYLPNTVRYPDTYPSGMAGPSDEWWKLPGLRLKHGVMNRLHNHFEVLEGTVEEPSLYASSATPEVRDAIGKLNTCCHEIESKVLSERKAVLNPFWVRPSQINSFFHAPRYHLTDEHREGFWQNGFDREMGGVYMHWCQIGKTVHEVFRDEGEVPIKKIGNGEWIIEGTCEAVSGLHYYSGEFDIEWGNTIRSGQYDFFDVEQHKMFDWLERYADIDIKKDSLGHLKIGQVNIREAFGNTESKQVWDQIGKISNIHRIEAGDVSCVFPYLTNKEIR